MNSSSLKESEPFKQELQSILGSILDDYVELQKEAKELREEIRKLRMDYNHLKNIDDTIHKIGRKAGIVQHDDWDKCGDDCED